MKLDITGPRSRKVVRRTTHRVVGRSPSLKSNRVIHWESQLERDMIRLLEFDPDVLRYSEQPDPLFFMEEGKRRKYTPDFLVETRTGLSIIEVKPADQMEEEPWLTRLALAADHFRAINIPFKVMTDHEIRREPRLSNVIRILRYQRQPVSHGHRDRVLELIGAGAYSAEQVLKESGIADLSFTDLCALIARGDLRVDIDREFGPHSFLHTA